jgi:hypothetical protein
MDKSNNDLYRLITNIQNTKYDNYFKKQNIQKIIEIGT